MLPGITLTTLLLFSYPGEDEEKAGRLCKKEKTLFVPGKRGNKGTNCIHTYTVPVASSPWAPELVVTVWQCTAAGCVLWLIYSYQLHSSLLVPTEPQPPYRDCHVTHLRLWLCTSNRGMNQKRINSLRMCLSRTERLDIQRVHVLRLVGRQCNVSWRLCCQLTLLCCLNSCIVCSCSEDAYFQCLILLVSQRVKTDHPGQITTDFSLSLWAVGRQCLVSWLILHVPAFLLLPSNCPFKSTLLPLPFVGCLMDFRVASVRSIKEAF